MKVFRTILFLSVPFLINAQNDIFEIARNGCFEDLDYVLTHDYESINFKNSSGFTPLILASYHDNIEIASILVKKVRNIDALSNMGTALMASVFKNHINITKLLIDAGADVNITDPSGTSALHYAVRFGYTEQVELLIASGADKNLLDNNDKSPLDYANQLNNNTIINLLNK